MKWRTAAAVLIACCAQVTFNEATFAVDSRREAESEMQKPVVRGGIVFKSYCSLCNGERGDGVERAAKLYGDANLEIGARPEGYYDKIIRAGGAAVTRSEFIPPPAYLTWSDINDHYKSMIFTYGGAAMGRAPVMPVWGEQLSSQEIEDVVNYLRTLVAPPAQ